MVSGFTFPVDIPPHLHSYLPLIQKSELCVIVDTSFCYWQWLFMQYKHTYIIQN
jgi:hypothetical protein